MKPSHNKYRPSAISFGIAGKKAKIVLLAGVFLSFSVLLSLEALAKTGGKPIGPGQHFNMEQTLSDGAQRNTIGFDALGFMTGSICADTFLPPGKVADFFGFQYLRDNDPDQMGHNTDFVTKIANNVFHVLNQSQKDLFEQTAKKQVERINSYAYARFPLIKAFRRLQSGDIPQGSTGLDQKAVMAYSAEIYGIDAEISIERADLFGRVIRSLDEKQRRYLDTMATAGMMTWADLPDQIDKKKYSHDVHVLMMTFASEMFSWYRGTPEADAYFCPERQGTYFGSFYLKDIPAMGKPNYTLDSNLTANSGESLIKALPEKQARQITDLVESQKSDLGELSRTRLAISLELRNYLKGDSIDTEKVKKLARKYGELDGSIVYSYATTFCSVYKSLTDEQKAAVSGLRNLKGYECRGAYLYSKSIEMPEIMNTDFLFGKGTRPKGDPVKISGGLMSEDQVSEDLNIDGKVKTILSGYNKENLTSSDARAINEAFRKAGIRKGPGMRDAIRSAGFDPDTIRRLDPPPDEKRP